MEITTTAVDFPIVTIATGTLPYIAHTTPSGRGNKTSVPSSTC